MKKKKYKLIKEYPNSPHLGCIVYAHEGQSITMQLGEGLNFEPFIEISFIPSTYPDNWLEIERSSFITDDGERIEEGDEYWFVEKRPYVEGHLPESNSNLKKFKHEPNSTIQK